MERLTERTGEGQAIPRMDMKNNGHQKCMERLAEYEDLEEQGRMLKLPCTVGDIVYSFSLDRIITLRVDNIIVFENGIDIRVVGATEEDKHIRINLDIEEFCQKCFPTREEVVFKILKI